MFSLSGKQCLVIGGSGGIGAEIVAGLTEQGAAVAFTYFQRAQAAQELSARIVQAGGPATHFRQYDATDRSAAADVVNWAVKQLGGLDAVIITTGTAHTFSPLEKMTDDDLDLMIEVELRSIITLARVAFPVMVKQQSGRFITIGSDSGKVGTANATVSSACRGGIISFTRAAAREFARHNVLVNAICPGPTDTELWRTEIGGAEKGGMQDRLIRAMPMRRIATATEVAGTAVFLVSNEAGFITGQAISVSGGMTMQ
jgi:NAD(P)-dependent dehydrogenase (short-subunit alcohol dehydrogenase family)